MSHASHSNRPIVMPLIGLAWFALTLQFALVARGQESVDNLAIVETICRGLNHPCGVAIHPGTGSLIVSNSGAGSIVEVVEGAAVDLITGFPLASLDDEFPGSLGPLGIAFATTTDGALVLFVGTAGGQAGVDRIGVYPFSGDQAIGPDNPVSANAELFSRSLNKFSGYPAEHDFYGVASFGTTAWFTCRGDPEAGWIGKFEINNFKAMTCERFARTTDATGTTRPTAITISPDGFVVVGNCGEPKSGTASVIGFYDMESKTGQLRAKFETQLDDIVSLGWSPVDGQLYALDCSRDAPQRGGLYRLVATDLNRSCRADLIQPITWPTAMAFGPGGKLFVTTLGENPSENSGQLICISGLELAGRAQSSERD